jgi:hypothetical protein
MLRPDNLDQLRQTFPGLSQALIASRLTMLDLLIYWEKDLRNYGFVFAFSSKRKMIWSRRLAYQAVLLLNYPAKSKFP